MNESVESQRVFPRRAVNFEVDVTFSNRACSTLKAKNISQGGMYIVSINSDQPTIGELLSVKLAKDTLVRETIPFEDAVVVHKGKSGFGLSFVEISDML